jgi:phosphate transport system substrate-binding protein
MKKLIAVVAMAMLACACGKADQKGAGQPAGVQGSAQINGAGATFPGPLYQAWAQAYQQETSTRVSYQPIGSGGGIKQIKAGTVDFGGTDKPQTAAELAAAKLDQFPTVLGGVVPVVNIPGVSANQLRLDGPLLGDIFLGKVKSWTDPRITAQNPGVKLPNLPISVVHRSDGSGTTFLFTTYLADVSAGWKAGPGASDAIEWPAGIGGKGNDGVAAFVKQTAGSIGYVEYAFAKQNGLAAVTMKNKAGAYVAPTAAAFAAAAEGAKWDPAQGFYVLLLNQPGQGAWPVTGATFILLRQDADPAKRDAVRKFFGWAYDKGDAAAGQLDYVPLPAAVKDMVRTSWSGAPAAPAASQ